MKVEKYEVTPDSIMGKYKVSYDTIFINDFLSLSNIYYFYDGSRTGCSIASFYLLKNIMGGFEMIKIGRLPELDKASHYPKELQEKILEDVEIIANEYGDNNQRRL